MLEVVARGSMLEGAFWGALLSAPGTAPSGWPPSSPGTPSRDMRCREAGSLAILGALGTVWNNETVGFACTCSATRKFLQ